MCESASANASLTGAKCEFRSNQPFPRIITGPHTLFTPDSIGSLLYDGRYWTKVELTRVATRSHALGALQRVATRHSVLLTNLQRVDRTLTVASVQREFFYTEYSPQFPCVEHAWIFLLIHRCKFGYLFF